MREIRFYTTEDGQSPIQEFFDSLSGKSMQKVAWTLQAITELPVVPSEYLKKLSGTGGLWEVRVHSANQAIRLLGFFDGNDLIVLTHGFMKKSEKIPRREIDTAEARMNDHKRRKAHK